MRHYVEELVRLHRTLRSEGLYTGDRSPAWRPTVSAGGSTYPDVVTQVLAPLAAEGAATVVLRSGVYLAHDDGLYRDLSPWGHSPRGEGLPLRPALHVWGRVTSRPEPDLAIVDIGRRDVGFDAGMPVVQVRRTRSSSGSLGSPGPVDGISVRGLNDQHAFVDLAADATPLAVGDLLRFGVSHPCTTFDRWGLLPLVDDADADDPLVVGAVRTFF